MKVNVLGKEYVSGTSKKTGKPFEGTVVHVSHKKNGCDGVAVESIWLDPISYPVSSIQCGAVYEVDRDNKGYLLDFALCSPGKNDKF